MKKIVISPFAYVVTFTTMLIAIMQVQPAQASICVNPKNEAERTVCASAELKIIADVISKSYFQKKATLSPMEQQEIERDQKLWRSFLKNCKSDKNCLRDAFNERLTEIQDFDKVIEKKDENLEEGEEEEEEEGAEDGVEEDEEVEEDAKEKKDSSNSNAKKSKNSKKSKDNKASKDSKKSKGNKSSKEDGKPADDKSNKKESKLELEEDKLEDKDEDLSFMQRFSNWLFPKVESTEKISEPKITKSSALVAEDALSSNYVTYQSDLETSMKAPKSAMIKNDISDEEKSDFEVGSNIVQAEENSKYADLLADNLDDADKTPNQTDIDVASEQTEQQATDETLVTKADDAVTEQTKVTENEEAQPSFFSRIFSFFSFGDDDKKAVENPETAIAEGGAVDSDTADNQNDKKDNVDAETLGDLVSATDDKDPAIVETKDGTPLKKAEQSVKTAQNDSDLGRKPVVTAAKNKLAKAQQKIAHLKNTDVAEQSSVKGRTVQKPFVQEAQRGANGSAGEQPAVKPSVSIFKKIASFFSSAPKTEENNSAAKTDETVEAVENPASSPQIQLSENAKSQNNDRATVDEEGSDLAAIKQPKAVTQKVAEKTEASKALQDKSQTATPNKTAGPSLYNRIAGFFSSKPKDVDETKLSLSIAEPSKTEVAGLGSDLAQENTNDGLNNEPSTDEEAAGNISTGEAEAAPSEAEEILPMASPAIPRRTTKKRVSSKKVLKRRNSVKRVKAAKVRKSSDRKVARKRTHKAIRSKQKRHNIKARAASKLSKRQAKRVPKHGVKARRSTKRLNPVVKKARIKRLSRRARGNRAAPSNPGYSKAVAYKRAQRPASMRRANVQARQNFKRNAISRTVRRVHYKPVYVKRAQARGAMRQRYVVQRCPRCVRCSNCGSKAQFRLKHHLREYY